jgi:hypothetical protein
MKAADDIWRGVDTQCRHATGKRGTESKTAD